MDQDQNNARQQIIDRLKDATNVLVTVSANPSVDQLAGAIGLTLLLNKLGKHGTAVFSGQPPSTLEFLELDKTLEKTTDSLRDFIIALDKSKADKLRYKVEEKVVKIFITPYRTNLSADDLEFSQGDFNVEVVIALGVHQREELDQAIASQGRILHDATIISINDKSESSLGTINWHDDVASSLCEMIVFLGEALKSEFLDAQMATALLTGIVAETDRFSNDKTTPRAMTVAGKLMTAGANQQLIATKLEEPELEPPAPEENHDLPNPPNGGAPADGDQQLPPSDDGTLQIAHDGAADSGKTNDEPDTEPKSKEVDDEVAELPEPQISQIHIDEHGNVKTADEPSEPAGRSSITDEEPLLPPSATDGPRMILEPPVLSGGESAATADAPIDPLVANDDPLSLPPLETPVAPLLSRDSPPAQAVPSADVPASPLAEVPPVTSSTPPPTLSQIEETIHSPHAQSIQTQKDQPADDKPATDAAPLPDADSARMAADVARAAEPDTQPLEPLQALGSQGALEVGHSPELTLDTPADGGITPLPMPGAAAPAPATPFAPYIEEPSTSPSAQPTPPLPAAGPLSPATKDKKAPPVPPPFMPGPGSIPSSSNPFTLPPAP